MKKIFTLLSLLCFTAGLYAQDFKIVGYVVSWGGTPNIQYSKLTHLNYSFAEPTTDGTGNLKPLDNPTRLQNIVTNAHANNVKVLIAVGGYADGNDVEWATLASNSTSITNFRNNVMALVWQYNLDGVDIDWEFPSTLSESTGFTNLMTSLADTLHKSNKYLSAAVVAEGSTAGYISSTVFNLVDWINIMAYDNCCSVAHSSYGYAVLSLDYWIARHLPASKAILGVPFYGKSLNGGNSTSYSAIIANNTANSQFDYYTNSGNTDIYYNGIPTMKSKTTYAKNNGGGIMIWQIAEDAADPYSLLSAINEVQPAIQTSVSSVSTFSSSLYPNPARDIVYVESGDAAVSEFSYDIVDLTGKSLLTGAMTAGQGEISVASLPRGMYMLHLKSEDKVSVVRFVKE